MVWLLVRQVVLKRGYGRQQSAKELTAHGKTATCMTSALAVQLWHLLRCK